MNEMNGMISIIIPAYNETEMISITAETISGVLEKEKILYELIFVDDGSNDGTWGNICSEAKKSESVSGIRFSRNFGKEAAIFAGLEIAQGDCCIIIDCDLQHPPEKILEMYRLWEQGYEVIEGIKENRGEESNLYGLAAKLFYILISKATGLNMSNASDFKLLDRKVIDALNSMPERNVFFRALSYWIGYKKTEVHYTVEERKQGESKWSTKTLLKYALTNIAAFSSVPMQLVTICGIIMLIFSTVFGTISFVQKITGQAVEGFTTVILILLFSSSVIMISLGIIGYYISKIYDEIKGRPRYIVSNKCNR